jgi:type IV secretory pathway VirB2 component (pilin)
VRRQGLADDPFGSVANVAAVAALVGALIGWLFGRRGAALADWALGASVIGGIAAAVLVLFDALHLV